MNRVFNDWRRSVDAWLRTWLRPSSGARGGEDGFNLIEIMVTIAIIGVLMAVVGINVIGVFEDSKVDATKSTMNNVKSALTMYKLDNGRYPTTSEGLNALLSAPPSSKKPGKKYLEAMPKDGWDQEFIYYSPGTHGNHDYELISLGGDGREGGDGTDADIHSWEEE